MKCVYGLTLWDDKLGWFVKYICFVLLIPAALILQTTEESPAGKLGTPPLWFSSEQDDENGNADQGLNPRAGDNSAIWKRKTPR